MTWQKRLLVALVVQISLKWKILRKTKIIVKPVYQEPDFPKTVGPDRQKCNRTDDFKIYISDRMSGKTDIWKDRRLKFIPSQFPLPMALISIFSFIKMSDRDLKFVYLFCQTDTFLFVIENPIQMYVNVNILLVGTSTCKTWNIKT